MNLVWLVMMQGPFIYCLTKGAVDEMKHKIKSGAYANVPARVGDNPSVLQYATLKPAAARAAAPTTTGPAPGPAAPGPAPRLASIPTLAPGSAGSQQQAAPQPTTSTQARDARATRRAAAAAAVAAPSTLPAAATPGAGNSPTSSTNQVTFLICHVAQIAVRPFKRDVSRGCSSVFQSVSPAVLYSAYVHAPRMSHT
jgi:hypothetical protein